MSSGEVLIVAKTIQMQFNCVRCGSIDIKPEEPGRSTLRCGECKQRQRMDLVSLKIVGLKESAVRRDAVSAQRR